MRPRHATRAARDRIDDSSLAMIIAITASRGNPTIVRLVERKLHNRDLLTARLNRGRKRFRIRWWNLITMLGASALFVWCIIMVLDRLAS